MNRLEDGLIRDRAKRRTNATIKKRCLTPRFSTIGPARRRVGTVIRLPSASEEETPSPARRIVITWANNVYVPRVGNRTGVHSKAGMNPKL